MTATETGVWLKRRRPGDVTNRRTHACHTLRPQVLADSSRADTSVGDLWMCVCGDIWMLGYAMSGSLGNYKWYRIEGLHRWWLLLRYRKRATASNSTVQAPTTED